MRTPYGTFSASSDEQNFAPWTYGYIRHRKILNDDVFSLRQIYFFLAYQIRILAVKNTQSQSQPKVNSLMHYYAGTRKHFIGMVKKVNIMDFLWLLFVKMFLTVITKLMVKNYLSESFQVFFTRLADEIVGYANSLPISGMFYQLNQH